MDISFIRKVNLAEQLSDARPGVRELTEAEITAWDEAQIRAHYTTDPASIAGQSDSRGINISLMLLSHLETEYIAVPYIMHVPE